VHKSETTTVSFVLFAFENSITPDMNSPASDDVKNVDLTKVHNLSGPIAVEGAEPGDCLVVDILDSESSMGFVMNYN
jgi:acetamidase/formamidase